MTRKTYQEIAELIEQRAPAITMSELADRGVRSQPGQIRPLRSRRARPGVTVAALIGTAAVAVAVVAGALALSGGPARSPATLPSRHPALSQPAKVMLTDAMVAKIAQASHAALASAGHIVERLTDKLGSHPAGSDLFDITFSHQNYNQVTQPNSRHPLIVRVVGGRIFFYDSPPPGRPPRHWYVSTTQRSGGQAVPDPRKLLSALRPTAKFENLGRQVIDGVRVEHLRATNLAGLDKDLRSLGISWQPLTQFDIWVDSSGVIRFLELHNEGPSQPTGLIDRITVTIRFLDIGKPEHIVAPAHYGREATHN